MRNLLFFFTTFLASYVFSQSTASTLKIESGKPITLSWPDGRVAILKNYIQISPKISLDFQIHENTCNDFKGQICKYKIQFLESWSFMAWQKHPDAKKIGEIVKSTYGRIFEQEDYIAADSKDFYPIAKRLNPAEIECSDYSWIPGGGPSMSPKSVKIVRWENESMIENAETGLSENRTTGGAINVLLEKASSSQKLQIKSIKALTAGDFASTLLMFGDNVSWSLKDKNGELCQIAIKPAPLSSIFVPIDELKSQRPKAKDVLSLYLADSNELFYKPDGILEELMGWSYETDVE
jgi:hypothetical protein